MDEKRMQDEPVELARPDGAVKDLQPEDREGEDVKGGADFTISKLSDKASPTL
jgi:hypothetical protein